MGWGGWVGLRVTERVGWVGQYEEGRVVQEGRSVE